MHKGRAWAVLAALAVGLAVLFLNPPREQNTYVVEGDLLFMSGEINARTPDSLARMIAKHPAVETIVMLDMPGSVDEDAVHETGYFIRDSGLDTHLTPQSAIFSGAVDLFLAGNNRSMTCCAQIGVHDWSEDDVVGRDFPRGAPEHAANVAYFQDMLGSDAFYWFTLQAAPADAMHDMTEEELARFGVLTEPIEK